MLELDAEEVGELDDEQFRGLVGRLCEAELEKIGQSRGCATWGGHHNAPDGGVDVRVRIPTDATMLGEFPRHDCIFQIKYPNMPAAAITAEMRRDGILRPSIADLSDTGGAYVLVSAAASADPELLAREVAMQTAVGGSDIETRFLDVGRLTTWVRSYPQLVIWIRKRIGRPMTGWSMFGDWAESHEDQTADYLVDEIPRAKLPNEQQGLVTVPVLVEDMRKCLGSVGGAARLVGHSGTGKTRLAEALFDDRVGGIAIPQSLALYTNLSDATDPHPIALAERLLAENRRLVMIVDNCGVDLHNRLKDMCQSQRGQLSLLTIEYDIPDAPAEGTNIYRLMTASQAVILPLLLRRFPTISQTNRQTVSELAGGNARVAIALATTVRGGELIAHLQPDELFLRLFEQRRGRPTDHLLRVARACSLVYSFDGIDVRDNAAAELPNLAELAGLSVDETWEELAELKSRDLLQERGKWRALLPHAIANRLASDALRRLSPGRMDLFLSNAPTRLLRSFAHRLGFLHDCEEARAIAISWLVDGGRLGRIEELSEEEVTLLEYIAPAVPAATLDALTAAQERLAAQGRTLPGERLRLLIISIAYEAALFDRAFNLLLHLIEAEQEGVYANQVRRAFPHLFQLVLSGTQASLGQRSQVIRDLLSSESQLRRKFGLQALNAMLQASHFTGSGDFDFGGQYRDYGWQPTTWEEHRAWYREALALSDFADEQGRESRGDIRKSLLTHLRGLWSRGGGIHADIIETCRRFAEREFWPGAASTVKSIRVQRDQPLEDDEDSKLRQLSQALQPVTPEEGVRALVVRGGHGFWDDLDWRDYEGAMARANAEGLSLGRQIAADSHVLSRLLPELMMVTHSATMNAFAEGLVNASLNRHDLWDVLRDSYAACDAQLRVGDLLAEGIFFLRAFEPHVVEGILDRAEEDDALIQIFPRLQAKAGLCDNGMGRIRRSISAGRTGGGFYLALGYTNPPLTDEQCAELLLPIARLEGGFQVSLQLAGMRAHGLDPSSMNQDLQQQSRALLLEYRFQDLDAMAQHWFENLAEICLVGNEGSEIVQLLCRRVKNVTPYWSLPFETSKVIAILLKVQPRAGLNELLGVEAERGLVSRIFRGDYDLFGDPLDQLPAETLLEWCEEDPVTRYEVISELLYPFSSARTAEPIAWKPLAMDLIRRSPNPVRTLKHFFVHLHPSGWVGSEAESWERTVALLDMMREGFGEEVAVAAAAEKCRVTILIEEQRQSEARAAQGDLSFEP